MSVVLSGVLAACALLTVVRGVRIFRWLLDYLHMKRLAEQIPGPPGLPLVGNILDFVCDPDDTYSRLCEYALKYGPTGKVWLGPKLFLVIGDPEDLEAILGNSAFNKKSSFYDAVSGVTGKGLLVIDGPLWRSHRKAITPSLHLDILADFVKVFYAEAEEFAKRLASVADIGDAFDVRPMCGECANASICRTVLSMEDTGDRGERDEFVRAIPAGLDIYIHRLTRPWLLNDWLFSWTKLYPEAKRIQSAMDGFIKNVLRRKLEEIRRGQGAKKARRRLAFLDHILTSAEAEGFVLNKEELFHETKATVVTASGSSMDVLSLALYTLALRQDVQDKIVQEVNDVLGEDLNKEVTFDDLPRLHYVERFLKELMRFFPPAPFATVRHCPADVKLPSGYVAPKGCELTVFLPNMLHNPRWFPEPKKFEPDRFLPENAVARHPYVYIPFSAGPRNCIGQRYAMLFLKTAVATVVRKIRFLPAPDAPSRLEDVKIKMGVTLSVVGGAKIRVEARDKADIVSHRRHMMDYSLGFRVLIKSCSSREEKNVRTIWKHKK